MEQAPASPDSELPVTWRERVWVVVVLLFLCFFLFALIRTGAQAEALWKELDLGPLPVATQVLFAFLKLSTRYSWVGLVILALAAWLSCGWGTRSRRRMQRVLYCLCGFQILGFCLSLWALWQPFRWIHWIE